AFTITASNPVPNITSISPISATAGGAAFSLTVNGNNFVSASVVRWNGSNRPTTFGGTSQLTASIPASDIASAGSAAVTVFNPSPGGGTSNAQTLTVASASGMEITGFAVSAESLEQPSFGLTLGAPAPRDL